MKKQQEDQKKKELAQDEEYFKQVEKPGGRKYVVDKIEEETQKENKRQDDINTDLQSKQTRPFTYREALADYGMNLLKEADFGKDWYYLCLPTDGTAIRFMGKSMATEQGILLILASPAGNVYSRGIRTTADALLDSNAIRVLVTQAENTADSEKGLLLEKDGTKKTKSGIYVA
jgi:hypothetical protein